FAGLLHISADADRAESLAAWLTTLDAGGLTVVVERTGEPAKTPSRALRLELIGNDRPGIIRDISRVLANHQVNIEELETAIVSARMSGEPLFRARAHVSVPASVALAGLRRQLEALAGELMVDLTLDDARHADQR